MVKLLKNADRYTKLIMERISNSKLISRENEKEDHVFCFEKLLDYLPKKIKLSNAVASVRVIVNLLCS